MNVEDLRLRQLDQLREAARILLKPMERLPFPVVIEAMTGRQVLPMLNRPADKALLKNLARACMTIVADARRDAYEANRPNDVSTQVERKLEVALRNFGIRVERPKAERGRSPGGYPDRLIWYENEPTYLEVKVSREQNISEGSARNFFYQPTPNGKILLDARHLLVGFAIRETTEKRWTLTGWKIVDLWHLRVKLKPEYNANNLEIYRDEAILMEGDARRIIRQKPLGG
jgi:hypothetical protein